MTFSAINNRKPVTKSGQSQPSVTKFDTKYGTKSGFENLRDVSTK